MAVIKKRRTPHGKASRQQQLQQQQQLRAKQRFESSRLKPEQVSTMIHDESDTISYRSYLLMNYVNSTRFMDILMTQNVPNCKIRQPPAFRKSTLEDMKQMLASQRETLASMEEATNNYIWKLSDDSEFLKSKLQESEKEVEEPSSILKEYLEHFDLRAQDDRVVIHRNEFTNLRGDTREASPGYWNRHLLVVKEQKEKALILQRQKEEEAEIERKRLEDEEEEKKKSEIEEMRRRKVLEQQDHAQQQKEKEHLQQQQQLHLQLQIQQQLQQQLQQQEEKEEHQENRDEQQQQSIIQAQAQKSQQVEELAQHPQQQQQQRPAPNTIDSIFGEFGNEPFTNGFDDEFGDIDTAFF